MVEPAKEDTITRKLYCPKCGTKKETKDMQLRTKVGTETSTARACKHHARCGDYLCECKEVWNQCEVHRIDPPKHKNQRNPKDAAKKKQEKEEQEA